MSHRVSSCVTAERLARAARFFGLSELPSSAAPVAPEGVLSIAAPRAGMLTLLSGGNGSGKSTLLRALVSRARASGAGVLTPADLSRETRPVLSLFPAREPLDATLGRLGWTGLADAHALARPVRFLSDGERFRLALTLALARAEAGSGPTLLAVDEFAAVLDEAAAQAVCLLLRRTLDRSPTRLGVLLATWRENLAPALRPDVHVRCDYGEWRVTAAASASSGSRPG